MPRFTTYLGPRTELAGFVVCRGRINLDAVRADRGPAWWLVVDVLRALGQLQGYDVRITLGGRACTIAEAIAAVAPPGAASRGPSAADVEAYRRRVRMERQAKEPPRPRGKEPPYGPSAARAASSGRGSPGPSNAGARAAPPRPPPPPPPPPAPASARAVGPVEFFLARTGLRRPFDLGALKKAFKRGVKNVHPDQRPGDRHAHEEFCRFKKGYDQLVAEVTRTAAR